MTKADDLNLPVSLIVEKNKLFPGDSLNSKVYEFGFPGTFDEGFDTNYSEDWQTYAYREIIEIQMASGSEIRIVNNSEDIYWGGYTWTKFSFLPGDMTYGDESEDKSLSIKVSAIGGYIRGVIEASSNKMRGDKIIYRRIHTKYPDDPPLNIAYFEIQEIRDEDEWMVFELGRENFYLRQVPAHVYRRNTCRYWAWQTDVCPYTNNTSCDRSFATCISLGQSAYFGGQPGIPGGVWIVS